MVPKVNQKLRSNSDQTPYEHTSIRLI